MAEHRLARRERAFFSLFRAAGAALSVENQGFVPHSCAWWGGAQLMAIRGSAHSQELCVQVLGRVAALALAQPTTHRGHGAEVAASDFSVIALRVSRTLQCSLGKFIFPSYFCSLSRYQSKFPIGATIRHSFLLYWVSDLKIIGY